MALEEQDYYFLSRLPASKIDLDFIMHEKFGLKAQQTRLLMNKLRRRGLITYSQSENLWRLSSSEPETEVMPPIEEVLRLARDATTEWLGLIDELRQRAPDYWNFNFSVASGNYDFLQNFARVTNQVAQYVRHLKNEQDSRRASK